MALAAPRSPRIGAAQCAALVAPYGPDAQLARCVLDTNARAIIVAKIELSREQFSDCDTAL
jgi:imidazoleglycerol phosphate dehydratase HisB